MLGDLITTAHAASLLGCAEAFVVRRIYVGNLPGVWLPSGGFLVPEAAVRDLAASARIDAFDGRAAKAQ